MWDIALETEPLVWEYDLMNNGAITIVNESHTHTEIYRTPVWHNLVWINKNKWYRNYHSDAVVEGSSIWSIQQKYNIIPIKYIGWILIDSRNKVFRTTYDIYGEKDKYMISMNKAAISSTHSV